MLFVDQSPLVADQRAQMAAMMPTTRATAEPSWKRPALLLAGGALVGTTLGGGKDAVVRKVVPLGITDVALGGTATVPAGGDGAGVTGVTWIWPSENCETGATGVAGLGAAVTAAQGVVWP